jgi:hypothetical protein
MLRRHRGCRVNSWVGRLRSFATLVTILAALPGAFGTLALFAYWLAPLLVPWSPDFGDPPRLPTMSSWEEGTQVCRPSSAAR